MGTSVFAFSDEEGEKFSGDEDEKIEQLRNQEQGEKCEKQGESEQQRVAEENQKQAPEMFSGVWPSGKPEETYLNEGLMLLNMAWHLQDLQEAGNYWM